MLLSLLLRFAWLGLATISSDAFSTSSTAAARSNLFGGVRESVSSPLSIASSSSLETPGDSSKTQLKMPSTASASVVQQRRDVRQLPKWKSKLVKAGMLTYITGVALALPATLLPQRLVFKSGLLSREQHEHNAVRTACFCARWMLRFVPFCDLGVVPSGETDSAEPTPSVWVCNHVSMLDLFLLLATDKKLRGPNRRPIKIIYWKQLEANPVVRLLFKQAGFIGVDMEANGSGTANSYDRKTFKKLLTECKQAFEDGFDIAILPEGQLNPAPENGVQPVFSGAYTLAKMSRRPIQMMALHGPHNLWHADESIGMDVKDRRVKVRCYPHGRVYSNPDDFKETFSTVVGQFGATGEDLPPKELKAWLTGVKWEKKEQDVVVSS